MARISKSNPTALTLKLTEASKEVGEKNDCSVTALAAITGKTYKQARKALAAAGRETGKGVFQPQMEAAALALGFKLEPVGADWIESMIASYPGIHKTLKHITTHHPLRFPKSWVDVKEPLLFHVARHYAGYAKGALNDWTVDKPKRVIEIFRVVPVAK